MSDHQVVMCNLIPFKMTFLDSVVHHTVINKLIFSLQYGKDGIIKQCFFSQEKSRNDTF